MPGDFDTSTSVHGRGLASHQFNQLLMSLAHDLSFSYVRDKNGNVRFKKNAAGKIVDKEGKVINLPEPMMHQLDAIETGDLSKLDLYKLPGETNEQYLKRGVDLFAGEYNAIPIEKLNSYQKYGGERLQEFLPEQEALFRDAEQFPQMASQSNIRPQQEAMAVPGATADEAISTSQKFMAPYQDLFNSWKNKSSEEFKDRVNKEINPQFVKSGSWGSGGHRALLQKTLEKNQQNLQDKEADYLSKAMQDALHRGDSDTARRLESLKGLRSDEENEFKKKLAVHGIRENIGEKKQRHGQHKKDFAYEEAVREKEYPMEQAIKLTNLSQGLAQNAPSEITTMNVGSHPSLSQPSRSSIEGAQGMLMGSMLGKTGAQMMPQQFFNEGGSIDHYEAGGSTSMFNLFPQKSYLAPKSPLDLVKSKVNKNHSHGVMDLFAGQPMEMDKGRPTDQEINLNTPEVNRMREHAANLGKTQATPFWDALGGYAAGMLGSKGKNTAEMMMGGGEKALDAFNKSYSDKEKREDKITNLNKAIQDTRQIQMDREMNYRQIRDTLNINKTKANAADRRAASSEGRAAERFAFDKEKDARDNLLEEKKLDILSDKTINAAMEKKAKAEDRTKFHEKDYFERRKSHEKEKSKRGYFTWGHGDTDAKQKFIEDSYMDHKVPPTVSEKAFDTWIAKDRKGNPEDYLDIEKEVSKERSAPSIDSLQRAAMEELERRKAA